jgi:hypothetical protein
MLDGVSLGQLRVAAARKEASRRAGHACGRVQSVGENTLISLAIGINDVPGKCGRPRGLSVALRQRVRNAPGIFAPEGTE